MLKEYFEARKEEKKNKRILYKNSVLSLNVLCIEALNKNKTKIDKYYTYKYDEIFVAKKLYFSVR